MLLISGTTTMRQSFIAELESAGCNQKKLLSLMNSLDSEKRSVKSHLSRLSSEPDEQYSHGKERQILIRRMKDKLGFLTEEREMVRKKLGQIKMDRKTVKKVMNKTHPHYQQAFIAAATRILSEEQFTEIELRAAQICESSNP